MNDPLDAAFRRKDRRDRVIADLSARDSEVRSEAKEGFNVAIESFLSQMAPAGNPGLVKVKTGRFRSRQAWRIMYAHSGSRRAIHLDPSGEIRGHDGEWREHRNGSQRFITEGRSAQSMHEEIDAICDSMIDLLERYVSLPS